MFNCALVGTDRVANSFASANGNNGRLRASVQARIDGPTDSGAARGTASATLIDTITLTSPIIKVSIDINGFTTQHTGGEADFAFVFRFADPTPDNLEDQGPTRSSASRRFAVTATRASIRAMPSICSTARPRSRPAAPSRDRSISRSTCPTRPLRRSSRRRSRPSRRRSPSTTRTCLFEFTLVARASCDDDPCSATSRLDETLYIELEGKSANGCSYLGRDAVDPPPTGIVEPASGLMLLGGLAALAATLRGRRRHGQHPKQ